MAYKWKFFKSARCVQAKLEKGEDIAALGELDQKLWTVLSASTDGLRFDPATLKLLDGDGDGRIRVPEVLAAVDWMKARFKNLDFLFKGEDQISLSELRDDTEDGKALLKSFKNILYRAGHQDATTISLGDVTGTTAIFNGQPFNGDGIVTANSTSDTTLSDIIAKIIATKGAVKDRCGDDGVDQAHADAFFADCAAFLAWRAKEKDVAVLGDKTPQAYAAFAAVETKIDEYFTPPADLPLVADDPTPTLPLTSGVNPLWLGKFRAFAADAVAPMLNAADVESISRDEWAMVKSKLAPYGAWKATKAGADVESLGDALLANIVKDGKTQTAVNDLIGKDLALAEEYAHLVDCERALRYARNLATWLCNYVNQANIYDPSRDNVFRTGKLLIDGRECQLCFHVVNEGAHAALAEKSKCCLLYVKLSRKATGESREVCAVVTAGPTAPLYAGRNGIFYDTDGNDWDAVVVKVVEAQVSLKEAFWAPWAKIATTLSEQCKKFLSSKQDAAVSKVGSDATAAVAASQPASAATPAPAPNGAALASSVAALGVGVGMAGAACAGLIGLIAGLPLWKVLAGVCAIILLVSLPSVILAWFKLRARDLGAILNAGGWAVNRPLYFSIGLAKTFTRPVKMPMGSAVARDPYATHGVLKTILLLLVLAGAAVGLCWKMECGPFKKKAPEPAAQPQVAPVAQEKSTPQEQSAETPAPKTSTPPADTESPKEQK